MPWTWAEEHSSFHASWSQMQCDQLPPAPTALPSLPNPQTVSENKIFLPYLAFVKNLVTTRKTPDKQEEGRITGSVWTETSSQIATTVSETWRQATKRKRRPPTNPVPHTIPRTGDCLQGQGERRPKNNKEPSASALGFGFLHTALNSRRYRQQTSVEGTGWDLHSVSQPLGEVTTGIFNYWLRSQILNHSDLVTKPCSGFCVRFCQKQALWLCKALPLPGYSFLIWKLESVQKGSSRPRGHPSFTWPSSLRFQVRDADFFGVLSFPEGRDDVKWESGWQGPETAPCLTCLEPAAAQSTDPLLQSLLAPTDKCPPAALMTKKVPTHSPEP